MQQIASGIQFIFKRMPEAEIYEGLEAMGYEKLPSSPPLF
jgi:hypothetical protein